MALDLKNSFPPLQLGRREPYILERCAGRSVLDLGFVDVGLAEEKAQAGNLLHQWIRKVAGRLVGIDIDGSFRHLLPEPTDSYEYHFGNVEDPSTYDPVRHIEFDVIVAGEILEHLNNPGLFLWTIRDIMRPHTMLLVTVPNGLRFQIAANVQQGIEMVHPDHNYWYSPATIQTLLNKNGFHVDFLRGYSSGSETPQQLGPFGLGCPGLIVQATVCQPDEIPRRWPAATSTDQAVKAQRHVTRAPPPPSRSSAPVRSPGLQEAQPSVTAPLIATPIVRPQNVARSAVDRPPDPSGQERQRARILCITDQRGWAYENIVNALSRQIGDRYQLIALPYNEFAKIGLAGIRKHLEDADAVYCFSGVMADEVYDLLSVRPMVVGIHGESQLDRFADKLTQRHLARFAAIGCLNERMAQRCLESKLHERVVVTYNGVDQTQFRPSTTGRAGRPIRCGWVGWAGHSAGKVKRFDSLVVPSCIAAGLPLLAALSKHNRIPFAEMPQYYRLVDVMLIASTGEGTSGPLLEAGASGCAMISTRVGAAEQLIDDGVNGFLVDGTVDSIAQRLHWCREHPEQTRRMGEAARETIVQQWTWARRAEGYVRLFDIALGERRTQSRPAIAAPALA